MNPHHEGLLAAPSPWVVRWAHLLRPQARVLDVACGGGRHLHYLHTLGHQVTGLDLDIASARAAVPKAELIEADIENHPWPLCDAMGTRQFDAVIVCNYLWRPLWPTLLASVAEGGVLIYETFAVGQERFGRPRRPEFLLQAGELLEACKSLQVLAYECGIDSEPPRALQRIAAVRDTSPESTGATRSLK